MTKLKHTWILYSFSDYICEVVHDFKIRDLRKSKLSLCEEINFFFHNTETTEFDFDALLAVPTLFDRQYQYNWGGDLESSHQVRCW